MAQHDHLYQQAVYYDIALERDVSREIAFFHAAFRHHAGRPLTSTLDLACGPGYHARALARQGLRAVGLDLRPEMVRFAQDRATEEGVYVDWQAADMRHFRLAEPVDLACCMFDGLDALSSDDDLVRHFQAVAANLRPGGLYLIDLTHPRDCSFEHYAPFHYHGERDGITVDIVWATNDPAYDLVTGMAEVALELHVDDHGRKQVIHDTARERLLFPAEIRLLAQLSGVFRVAGWYGDFDLDQPLDYTPASPRMIALLQKTSQPLHAT
jgi:SAM-dependent methyltransferase